MNNTEFRGFTCNGERCPSASNCQRSVGPTVIATAAFQYRRGPGDSACDSYLPIKIISTFKE